MLHIDFMYLLYDALSKKHSSTFFHGILLDGVQFAFLTSFQMVLICDPHFKNHCLSVCSYTVNELSEGLDHKNKGKSTASL